MNNKRISLFRRWTRAYFVTLFVGIIIIGACSLWWVKESTTKSRIDKTRSIAIELTLRVLDDQGRWMDDRLIGQTIKQIRLVLDFQTPMPILVVDNNGKPIFPTENPQNPADGPEGAMPTPPQSDRAPQPGMDPQSPDRAPPFSRQLLLLLEENPLPKKLIFQSAKLDSLGDSYVFISPVRYQDKLVGEVLIALPKKEANRVDLNYPLLISLLGGVLLLGWGTIYFLTKRLVGPIQEVAAAAKALMLGNYDIRINDKLKDKELFEMMGSFREMAGRLKQLESMRSLLLAGVTHELKTPIASIRGLVQAVRDDIVQGEEKREFLDISLRETRKLQRMVEDLLDFNGFATGALTAQSETVELNAFIREVVHQWQMAHESHQKVEMDMDSTLAAADVTGDPVRIQQIIVNLLNNSFHAIPRDTIGNIRIRINRHDDTHYRIDVADNGKGIPEDERPFIFERFYRGNSKKHTIRGLGLGLPFSLMLAKVQKGDLYCKETSDNGTTFSLTLQISTSP